MDVEWSFFQRFIYRALVWRHMSIRKCWDITFRSGIYWMFHSRFLQTSSTHCVAFKWVILSSQKQFTATTETAYLIELVHKLNTGHASETGSSRSMCNKIHVPSSTDAGVHMLFLISETHMQTLKLLRARLWFMISTWWFIQSVLPQDANDDGWCCCCY